MEIFDMGKYDLFVWGSIGIFVVALLVDFIGASNNHRKIKKQIKAQNRKTDVRRKQA
ncbi:hypothetical protein MNBD_GAMMA02-1858 [hydrothermal vent metagenome]|uniref:Heme exporter protein D n=1 Tax=hydrothermal vent metagenome TaxID=652676 RepID=A0A3B0VSH4_9ZZZZ